MFSWGTGIAIPSLALDTTKERDPPPPATPLDFPAFIPDDELQPPNEASCDNLHWLLSRIKRPQDMSGDYLKALGLQIQTDVDIQDIVPSHGSKSQPPFQWDGNPTQTSASDAPRMSNGAPFPNKEKYNALRDELLYENDDAFRTLARLEPLPGRPKLRVTHTRKFWTGLELMAQFWDTSLDQYIERPVEEAPGAEENGTFNQQERGPENGQSETVNQSEDKMDIDDDSKTKVSDQAATDEPKQPAQKTTYIGRRMGTGRDMPESSREDTVRGFVEMVAWSFGCQTSIPALPPRLSVKGLLFPVRQNFTVGRPPQDRQVARRGVLEGPILFAQCRGDTLFHDHSGETTNRYPEVCDLLREVAAMLLFAQERARDGSTEEKPGDGKWWTTEPRWGGAPNDGPVGEPENGKSEEKDAPPDPNKRSKHDRFSLSHRRGGSSSRKRSMSEQWKIVQPGPGLWDRKVRYMQIGKDKDSPFDDIFMISSINHHFAILHLRVHAQYLEWLASGKIDFPSETDGEQPWYKIVLRRTRWFDLFIPQDRADGLDALWAVLTHMAR